MWQPRSLRAKLIFTGVVVTTVPLVVASYLGSIQEQRLTDVAVQECADRAIEDLAHIAQGAYGICKAQDELLQQNVDAGLNVVRSAIARQGRVWLDRDETLEWSAINQLTKEATAARLPQLRVGEVGLGQNRSMATRARLVDQVKDEIGGAATIFQRMNEAGDMLRVATTVAKPDGTRAIGTYIPARNPDGAPNAVVSALLAGQVFRGRAFVVNKWYLTAYAPIFDDAGEVIGATYYGVPIESVPSLRRSLVSVKAGATGGVDVYEADGTLVISHDPGRSGGELGEARDADGKAFVREMIAVAAKGKDGEPQRYSYRMADASGVVRDRVAMVVSYDRWGWVIAADAYQDEFQGAVLEIETLRGEGRLSTVLTGLVALLASLAVWWWFADRIGKALRGVSRALSRSAGRVATTSTEMAQVSKAGADNATAQAASLDQITSALQLITASTHESATTAHQTDLAAGDVFEAAQNSAQAMEAMREAIARIKAASDETGRILGSIDEIAAQTNLLALNAAVEAARAGEAGKGFSVVAEEVRTLARRSVEATRSSAALIEAAQKSADDGVRAVDEVAALLADITDGIGEVRSQISDVAMASDEQARSVDQIVHSTSELDVITQSSVAAAAQSAVASEGLRGQSLQVEEVVRKLERLLGTSDEAHNDDGRRPARGGRAAA